MYVDPEWEDSATRAGFWVVGDDGLGARDNWFGIIEFVNLEPADSGASATGDHEGWRVWDSSNSWTDLDTEYTYGEWVTLRIVLDTTDEEYDFYIDGVLVANGAAGQNFIREVFLNSYNYGLDTYPNLNTDSYAAHWWIPPADTDNDGVSDDADFCPATSADDAVPSKKLGSNRWIVNEDLEWETNRKGKPSSNGALFEPTLADTHGCNCEQILDDLSERTGQDFDGHYKHGCSKSVVEEWRDGLYPLDSFTVSPYNAEAAFPEPVTPNAELLDGETYIFTASGVWSRVGGNLFDAQYSDKGTGWGENGDADNGDLTINGAFNLWGALNEADHTYTYEHVQSGTAQPEFLIWMNDVAKYPGNNDEPLTVDVALVLH